MTKKDTYLVFNYYIIKMIWWYKQERTIGNLHNFAPGPVTE